MNAAALDLHFSSRIDQVQVRMYMAYQTPPGRRTVERLGVCLGNETYWLADTISCTCMPEAIC